MSPTSKGFVFINKDAASALLSRSDGSERESIYRHAQPLRHRNVDRAERLRHLTQCGQESVHDLEHPRQDANEKPEPNCRLSASAATTLRRSPTPLPSYRNQLQGLFIEENIAALRNQADFIEIESFFWIRHIPRLQDQGGAVALSFIALAGAACGQDRADQDLFYSASSAYIQSLRTLARDLSTALGRVNIRTIAATLAMLMYQFFAPKHCGRQDWNVHISGLGSLVYIQGAHSFQEGLAHALFLSCRPSIISACIHARRATFLAHETWLRIPWNGRRKSGYQQLLDHLTTVPGLGERFNRIARISDSRFKVQERFILLRDLWAAVSNITRWMQSMSDRVSPTATQSTLDDVLVTPENESLPFPASFQFSSMANATMCRSAWAALIDIYNMLGLTYDMLATETDKKVPSPTAKLYCLPCSVVEGLDSSTAGSLECESITDNVPEHSGVYFCTGGNSIVRTQYDSLSQRRDLPIEAEDSLLLALRCRNFAQRLAHLVCMTTQYVIHPDNKAVGRYLSLFPLKMAIWNYIINLPHTTAQLHWAYRVVMQLSMSGMPFSANLLTDRPYAGEDFARSNAIGTAFIS